MALLLGFILGYVLAIPPGPLGLAAIRYGTRNTLASVIALAAGAGILDVLYSLAAMWASGGLLSALVSPTITGSSPGLMTIARLIIAGAMMAAGAVLLRRPARTEPEASEGGAPQWTQRLGLAPALLPFLVGIGFALTNIANPTFLPSLVVMSSMIRSAGMLGATTSEVLIFSIGFGLGNALWLVTLGMLVQRFRERISGSVLWRLRSVMGYALIGAGLLYVVRIVFFSQTS
jgi:threonine/homoserine/homoserine lactone efflux protein